MGASHAFATQRSPAQRRGRNRHGERFRLFRWRDRRCRRPRLPAARPASHRTAGPPARRGAACRRHGGVCDRRPHAGRQRAPEVAATRHGRQLNAEIVPGLAPEPGDIVLGKQTYSPFLNPAFERTLAEQGLTRLYITGLHTDCCARHTSGDAFQRGYDLVWVTDALQAFTDEAHQAGLEYFKTWYATDPTRQLRTVDELVGEWTAVPEPAVA